MVRLAAALLVAILAAACASPGSEPAGRAWYSGDPIRARAELDQRLADDSDSRALYLNELGVLDLEARDLGAASRRFEEAWYLMESLSADGADTVGAIIGSEASKQWRGDPYERAMNSYYLGIVNYLRGVHDNALAGFKNAIFVDSSRGDDRFDCDFPPALFLEGLSYRQIGESEMAARSFAAARDLQPFCNAFSAANDGNVVVLIDVGRGPTKVNAGAHGELTRFVAHAEVPTAIEILADDALLGRADRAGDVYVQATTRGGRAFDSVLETKSAVKSGMGAAGVGALVLADDMSRKHQNGMLVVGVALLLTSLAVRAEADTRHWTSLPHEVQLFRSALTPGVHRIEVRPSSGWRVAGPVIQEITVPPQGDVLVYQRVLR